MLLIAGTAPALVEGSARANIRQGGLLPPVILQCKENYFDILSIFSPFIIFTLMT